MWRVASARDYGRYGDSHRQAEGPYWRNACSDRPPRSEGAAQISLEQASPQFAESGTPRQRNRWLIQGSTSPTGTPSAHVGLYWFGGRPRCGNAIPAAVLGHYIGDDVVRPRYVGTDYSQRDAFGARRSISVLGEGRSAPTPVPCAKGVPCGRMARRHIAWHGLPTRERQSRPGMAVPVADRSMGLKVFGFSLDRCHAEV